MATTRENHCPRSSRRCFYVPLTTRLSAAGPFPRTGLVARVDRRTSKVRVWYGQRDVRSGDVECPLSLRAFCFNSGGLVAQIRCYPGTLGLSHAEAQEPAAGRPTIRPGSPQPRCRSSLRAAHCSRPLEVKSRLQAREGCAYRCEVEHVVTTAIPLDAQ